MAGSSVTWFQPRKLLRRPASANELLSNNRNTKGGNTTWNLRFDHNGSGKLNNYAQTWAKFRVQGDVSTIDIGTEQAGHAGETANIKAEVEVTRERRWCVASDRQNLDRLFEMIPIGWFEQNVSGCRELSGDERNTITDFASLWSLFETKVLKRSSNANTVVETGRRGARRGLVTDDLFREDSHTSATATRKAVDSRFTSIILIFEGTMRPIAC